MWRCARGARGGHPCGHDEPDLPLTGHNCPPSIIQRAVSRCQKVTSDLSVYQTNMELLYEKLTALGFEVERPGGTFYIFPKALEEDANAFCQKAREFDLLLVPATALG